MILPIILSFSSFSNANIREISEIAKGFLFFNTSGRITCHADCADDADSFLELGDGDMYPIYL